MYMLALALRYLLKRRIAYISIIAITFGVMTMIVVMSVMDGFQDGIKKSVQSLNSSLELKLRGGYFSDHYKEVDGLLAEFKTGAGGPVVATGKRLYIWAMLSARPQHAVETGAPLRQTPIQIVGTDAGLEREVIPWDKLLDDAALESPLFRVPASHRDNPFAYRDEKTGARGVEPGIVLGIDIARSLHVARGDLVTVTTIKNPNSFRVGEDIQHVSERFRVTGCFKTGRFDYDNNFVFASGGDLQELLGLSTDCHWVVARIKDPDQADVVRDRIESRFGDLLVVNTWRERVRILARALDIEKGVMLIIMFFTILVAGASICGILYMLVLEKTRDIGILMSMGGTTFGITGVFLAYGGVLGLVGTSLGVFCGLEVVWNLSEITAWLDQSLGFQVFPPEVYKFDDIPTKINYGEVGFLAMGTMVVSLLASLLPAWRAARLDPVKCLGYE